MLEKLLFILFAVLAGYCIGIGEIPAWYALLPFAMVLAEVGRQRCVS